MQMWESAGHPSAALIATTFLCSLSFWGLSGGVFRATLAPMHSSNAPLRKQSSSMVFLMVVVLGPLLVFQIIHGLAIHARAERGNAHVHVEGKSVDEIVSTFMKENDISGLTLAIVQAPYITPTVG